MRFWSRGLVVASRRFEGMYRLYLQGYESSNSFIKLKIQAVPFFDISKRNYPTTRYSNPEVMVCGHNISLFFIV